MNYLEMYLKGQISLAELVDNTDIHQVLREVLQLIKQQNSLVETMTAKENIDKLMGYFYLDDVTRNNKEDVLLSTNSANTFKEYFNM